MISLASLLQLLAVSELLHRPTLFFSVNWALVSVCLVWFKLEICGMLVWVFLY